MNPCSEHLLLRLASSIDAYVGVLHPVSTLHFSATSAGETFAAAMLQETRKCALPFACEGIAVPKSVNFSMLAGI